ncbi:MAG: hypothetical protein JSS63_05995 [Bacteroidetes bacterium]|nr:hypothetical protein [Bacteroidota bacterium]MBX7044793.1 hypothetical protein [Ignavibacteria bacterium]
MPTVKKILVVVSFLFYIVACCTDAYRGPTSDSGYMGIMCLSFGWLSFLMGFAPFVSWLANFPYFVNLFFVLFGKKPWMRLVSSMFAIVSLFLSFGAFGVTEILLNEAGDKVPATFGPALYLWIVSFLIMVVAAIMPAEKKPVEIQYVNNPNPIR